LRKRKVETVEDKAKIIHVVFANRDKHLLLVTTEHGVNNIKFHDMQPLKICRLNEMHSLMMIVHKIRCLKQIPILY
jgi:hypothetical protein